MFAPSNAMPAATGPTKNFCGWGGTVLENVVDIFVTNPCALETQRFAPSKAIPEIGPCTENWPTNDPSLTRSLTTCPSAIATQIDIPSNARRDGDPGTENARCVPSLRLSLTTLLASARPTQI